MQNIFGKRAIIIIILLVKVIIMTSIGVLSYRNINRLATENDEMGRMREVLRLLADTRSHLAYAEASHLEFIDSGNDEFQNRFKDAGDLLNRNLDQINLLTLDNPEEQKILGRIRELSSRTLEDLKLASLLNDKKGTRPPIQLISPGESVRAIQEIEKLIHLAEDTQTSKLNERSHFAQISTINTLRTSAIGSLISLGLLLGAYSLIRRMMVERRKAENEVSRQAREFEDLYNNSGCGYHSINADGVFLLVNDTELKWLGYKREELVNKKRFTDLLTQKSVHNFRDFFHVLQERGWVSDLEYEMIRKDGTVILVLLNATAIYDSDGRFLMSRAAIFDITDRKRLEAALREARDELGFRVMERTAELAESNQSLQNEIIERREIEKALRINESLKNSILSSLSEHLVVLNKNGEIIAVNDAWTSFAAENCNSKNDAEAKTGLGVNYLAVCRNSAERQSPEADKVLAGIEGVLGGSLDTFSLEYPCHSPQEQRWYLMTVSPMKGEGGGAVITHKNITERKLAEIALNEAQSRLKDIFDSSNDAIAYSSLDGLLLEFNEAFAELVGSTREEILGKKRFQDFTPAEFHDLDDSIVKQVVSLGKASDYEKEFVRNDGYRVPVLLTPFAVKGNNGKPVALAAIIKDLTQRKLVEQELQENRKRITNIIESAMDAIITVDSSQNIVLFNTAAEQMFGCPSDDAIGKPIVDFIPSRFRDSHPSHITNFGNTRTTRRSMGLLGSVFGVRSNGEEFPLEASISQMETGGQKFFTVILRDITERKRVEERLREQAALLNQTQDAIVVCDLDGRILFWNRGAERIYGWMAEEVIGRTLHKEWYPSEVARQKHIEATRLLLESGEWSGEMQQLTRDRLEKIIECSWTLIRDDAGKPKSFLIVNSDITDKKRFETQFLRAQRMESIGTLAGGIAHDLNNVLTPVLMAIQMLQMKIGDPDSQRWLSVMQKNVERGADMIKQVLLFARGTQGEQISLQPKHMIKEIVAILKETFPKSIDIKFAAAEEPWMIKGDNTQLHQVMMNLCVNARDAMPGGGKISIEVENRILDELYVKMHIDAKPGRFVMIKVSDTGQGISAENVNRIFEPFYTTKDPGKGTGLGLATTLGIVKAHNGFINVYSEIGKGTQFSVYLPATDMPQLDDLVTANAGIPTGDGETILVIDDEASIREITRNTLEAFGYRVLTANDGTDALAIFVDNIGRINAAITDMMMPYMDGPSTVRALQKLDPNVRIIASSGLDDNSKLTDVMNAGVRHFLSKPYTADKLLKTLADALNKY